MAEKPEDQGRIGEASHPRIMPVEKSRKAVVQGIVKGNPLFYVLSGWG
jgi:hypothetical protein